jgi:hypothetical protein
MNFLQGFFAIAVSFGQGKACRHLQVAGICPNLLIPFD